MCVVAAKYFKNIGWVLVKNRDRNYSPLVRFKQSFVRGIERLYLQDSETGYTEGLNEYGVSILSASLSVKDDEKEIEKRVKAPRENFKSKDGMRIRTALFEKTPKVAVQHLIDSQLTGNTIVANKDKCFLLESAFEEKGRKSHQFVYKVKEIDQSDFVVRTNHGILLPDAGYKNQGEQKLSRKSSDSRLEMARKGVKECTNPKDMMNAISDTSNKNSQMNPLRIDSSKDALYTTGTIMLVASELTFHYRPLAGKIEISDWDKINNNKSSKCSFEIISSKRLIAFKDYK